MNKVSLMEFYNRAKPYLTVIFLQIGYAGLSIIAKSALDSGMSHYTFSVYRNAVAAIVFAPFAILLERNKRPRMTISIFVKILILSLIEPVIDQNLFFAGMARTSALFTTAMTNILPAVTFLMAWSCRLEKVNIHRLPSQAKMMGTLVTVLGAMIMTLFKGTIIELPWTKSTTTFDHQAVSTTVVHQDPVKGSIMVIAGCFCWASFYTLQAITLRTYPAALSLTTLICLLGSLEGAALTLVVENGNKTIWFLGWDTKLFSALYGGIICSGISYYVSGLVMTDRGPVFVTAFSPLSMVMVAILGSFILHEQVFLGTVLGSVVIVIGLYVVLWGKTKDEIEDSSAKSNMGNTSDSFHPHDLEDYGAESTKDEYTHNTTAKIVPNDEAV